MLLPVSPSGTGKTLILFRWSLFLKTSSAPARTHNLNRFALKYSIAIYLYPCPGFKLPGVTQFKNAAGKWISSKNLQKLTIGESIIYFFLTIKENCLFCRLNN
jgi:hypothetical protein